jgi:hypothetical protein
MMERGQVSMPDEISGFMRLFEMSPSLVLYEDMIETEGDERDELLGVIGDRGKSLNPIEVVVESIINAKSEEISMNQITSSREKVLITPNVRRQAISEILGWLQEEKETKLERLHESWLAELVSFLKHLLDSNPRLKTDELLFQVSRRFRISGISAIRAVLSIRGTH